MRLSIAAVPVLVLASIAPAAASSCPGNPNALGTSRTIVVDPTEHRLLGTMQYRETLPLREKEVVLTFDDGPLPPYSTRILNILAAECVKATYFIVGRMAHAYPQLVRRAYAEGHTIGTHSQTHPFNLGSMALPRMQNEVLGGIASTGAALGNPNAVAPFFRIPGLARSKRLEAFLASNGLMTWSADFPADDWRRISAKQVMARALSRLEAKGRGVLLLHDIQPATALALPGLLKELKARGYRIVHVVPATASRVKTATAPDDWRLPSHRKSWPRTAGDVVNGSRPNIAPDLASFGIAASAAPDEPVDLTRGYLLSDIAQSLDLMPPEWSSAVAMPAAAASATLPVPSILTLALRYPSDSVGAEADWPPSPAARRVSRRASLDRGAQRRSSLRARPQASAARRQQKPSGASGLFQARYGQ